MASRDARYRSQAATERRRVEHYRDIALDAVAGLIISSGQDWSDLFGLGESGDLDRHEVRRRVQVLRERIDSRTR